VARAKLAQHHLRHVQEGQLVRYKGDAFPDITIVAKVALIEPSVDEGNGMVGIRLVLDAEKTLADPANARSLDPEKHAATRETIRSGRILIPGMFVSGAIILEHKPEAVAIPRKAISYARGRPFIFLIEPATPAAEGAEAAAHRVRRVYFTEGLAEEGYVEFVPSPGDPPLGPGALIVQVGQDRLRDGDPVRIESAQDGGGALSAEEDARPAGSSGSNGKD
jgi:hypothetical protein